MSSEIEVEQIELKLLSAMNKGNADAVLRHLHPKWNSFWPGGLRLFDSAMGRDGIRETFAVGFRFNLCFRDLMVTVYENMAITTGYLTGAVIDPSGASSEVNWPVSIIRIRQNGNWKAVHWHESCLG